MGDYKDFKITRMNIGNLGKGEVWNLPVKLEVRVWGDIKNGGKVQLEFVSENKLINQKEFTAVHNNYKRKAYFELKNWAGAYIVLFYKWEQ